MFRYTLVLLPLIALIAAGCGKKDAGPAEAADKKTKAPDKKNDKDKAESDDDDEDDDDEVAPKKALAVAEKAARKIEGAGKVIDTAKALTKKGPALSGAEYEKLMLALKDCGFEEASHLEWYMKSDCPALKKLRERTSNASSMMGKLGGDLAALGRKHLNHASPAVRFHAANLMSSAFGASGDSIKVTLAHLPKEKHAAVYYKIIDSIGSKSGQKPEVAKALITAADHKDRSVRRIAGMWLASSFAAKTENTLEKAMQLVDSDPDMKVRAMTCSNLYGRSDERVIPTLLKYVTPTAPEALAEACGESLGKLWASWQVEKGSEKAFDETIKVLSATTCTKSFPDDDLMDEIEPAATKTAEVKKKAPWWSDAHKKRLMTALRSLVVCKGASGAAREKAVTMLAAFGLDKATFAELRGQYTDKEGEDYEHGRVIKALDKQK